MCWRSSRTSGNPGRWGWGELLFELALNYDDHSDKGLRRLGTQQGPGPRGLAEAGFDDSLEARAQFLQPPQGVWGAIPYHGAVNERVQLSELRSPRQWSR